MNDNNKIDLNFYMTILKKYYYILFVIPLLFTLGTFAYFHFYALPEYKATATIFVGKQYSDEQIIDYKDILIANNLINTYSHIPTSHTVLKNTIDILDLNITTKKLEKNISASPIKNTQLIELSVTDYNPENAAVIANQITGETIIKIQQIMPANFVKILDAARVPQTPCNSGVVRYLFISFITGLIIALGITSALVLMNQTIQSSEDINTHLGLTTLGIVPIIKE